MSGGSYDYLYCQETHKLFEPIYTSYLEDMYERCIELGYEDVSRDFQRLIQYIKSAYIRVDVLRGNLRDVMKAIEWYDSADYGEDTVKRVIDAYRNSKEAPHD